MNYIYARNCSRLGTFSGTDAHQDAKASFSHQISEIDDQFGANAYGRKMSADSAYSRTKTLLRELAQYNDWTDSTWAPISLGGYYSSQEIKNKANAILGRIPPSVKEDVVVQRAIDKTPTHPVIEADCKTKAIEMFGPIMGLTPGADIFACHKGKFAILGIVIAILIVMILLTPYVNLATVALGGRRKKRGKK